jgi:hypothetical protein
LGREEPFLTLKRLILGSHRIVLCIKSVSNKRTRSRSSCRTKEESGAGIPACTSDKRTESSAHRATSYRTHLGRLPRLSASIEEHCAGTSHKNSNDSFHV